MKLNEYQELASRTARKDVKGKKLAEYGMGISGESGELTDYLKKVVFHQHQMDREHVREELGDILWYLSNTAKLCGWTLEEVATFNVEKLMKRYPDGFSSQDSIKRVDVNG
jgi:NTP pyrophosphatase (non-canonical NTP hydrolase)